MAVALSRKQWFALIVAVTLTAHYFFFRVPFVANDDGRNMAEWPLLADALISFPVLYYFMFRPSPKQFLLAWLAIATVIAVSSASSTSPLMRSKAFTRRTSSASKYTYLVLRPIHAQGRAVAVSRRAAL